MPSIKYSLDALKGLGLNTMYINMQSHGEDNIDAPFRAEHTVTYSHQLGVSAVTITYYKKKKFFFNQDREQDKKTNYSSLFFLH